MREINFQEFKDFIKTVSGKTFSTLTDKKEFVVQFTKDQISYIPKSSAKPRPHEDVYLKRVIDKFNGTNSFETKHYQDIAYNASYALALIGHYIARKDTENKIWRMAFRCGNQGPSLWEECKKYKVAAIAYDPLARIDLAKYPKKEPMRLWRQLTPTQQSSLYHIAYDMKKGDVIYVKEGTQIINRGTVQDSYKFDQDYRIISPNNTPWSHQVPVRWETGFIPISILLGSEPTTVLELQGERLEKLKQALSINSTVQDDLDSLFEEENFQEGGKKSGFVSYYERNPNLRAAAIRDHGVTCKGCGFNFYTTYGDRGRDYIEVHHLRPVKALVKKEKISSKNDMIVLCSNCHRMVHRRKDNVLTVEELRKIITT